METRKITELDTQAFIATQMKLIAEVKPEPLPFIGSGLQDDELIAREIKFYLKEIPMPEVYTKKVDFAEQDAKEVAQKIFLGFSRGEKLSKLNLLRMALGVTYTIVNNGHQTDEMKEKFIQCMAIELHRAGAAWAEKANGWERLFASEHIHKQVEEMKASAKKTLCKSLAVAGLCFFGYKLGHQQMSEGSFLRRSLGI